MDAHNAITALQKRAVNPTLCNVKDRAENQCMIVVRTIMDGHFGMANEQHW